MENNLTTSNAESEAWFNTVEFNLTISSDKVQVWKPPESGVWENSLILLCFSLIIAVSLAGNLLVVRTLWKQRRCCANSTNVLIGVLAVSDLMMTTFNIPFTVVDIILKDWIFGSYFCILVSFVQANSVYVSSFTMAVIAVNRYQAIYQYKQQNGTTPSCSATTPSTTVANGKRDTLVADSTQSHQSNSCVWQCCWARRRSEQHTGINIELQENAAPICRVPRSHCKLESKSRMVMLIFAIWFMAALHSLPHTIFQRVKPLNITLMAFTESDLEIRTVHRCVPDWPEPLLRLKNFNLFLTLFTSTTQYFIPLSCAGMIYSRIGVTIMQQGKVGEMSKVRAEQISQKKRRRLLMLVLIVAIFALCWLPFNVYYLLLDFGITKRMNNSIFLVCLWLATSSVCYNPFVYCWLNEHFQREAKQVLKRVLACLPLPHSSPHSGL